MKKTVLLLTAALLVTGCAAKLTMDRSGMIGPDGKYITVMSGTTRDRFGTELQTQTWFSDDGKVLATYQGAGPGVGTAAMQGAVAGLEQAGGLIGAGALIRPTSISGVSSSSSKSKSKQTQSQGQSQSDTFNPTNVNVPTNINTNTFNPVNTNTNKLDIF